MRWDGMSKPTNADSGNPEDPRAGYAAVTVTHHWAGAERRLAHGRSRRPECVVVGHAWADDPEREGWTLCLVCEVARAP